MRRHRKKNEDWIKNVVVVSDLHAGCQLGLFPNKRLRLDEGGFYSQSPLQKKIWSFWEEFWNQTVKGTLGNEPFAVVCNGDAIDGVHHNSVTQITHNLKDQVKIAHVILKPIVELCEGRYYHIRGTEAHVGKSGQYEELLAYTLNAIPTNEEQYARNDLWLRVGGGIVHFLHHVGTTSSAAYETTALMRELTETLIESARWERKPPTLIVRSHRHRFCEIAIPSRHGKLRAVITPGWQGKTPFLWKIPGARLSTPMFGGIIIRWSETTKNLYILERVWTIEPSEIETVVKK